MSLPLVGPELRSAVREQIIHLRRTATGGLEQIQILSASPLAGFEVITHGRF